MQRIHCCARCVSSVVRTLAFLIPRRRWYSYHPSVMHNRRFRLLLLLQGASLTGDLRGEQGDYAQNVYIYHLVNAATALAKEMRMDVGGGHTAITDISVGFGVDRQRLNVVCSEAPGVVVLIDPAMDDELEMDELLDGNYGAGTLTENERIHYGDLKDRYRQRRDRTRQLVAQLSTLNTRQTLNPESHGSPSPC